MDIFATDWYREIQAKTTPGDNLKIYRENHGLTQAQLGEMLGGIPRQHISNMERGIRPVSLKTARKLARVFKVSPGSLSDSTVTALLVSLEALFSVVNRPYLKN